MAPHLAFCRHNILKDIQGWLKLRACHIMEPGSTIHMLRREKKWRKLWLWNMRKPEFMHWKSPIYQWHIKQQLCPFLDIIILYSNYCISINTYLLSTSYRVFKLPCHISYLFFLFFHEYKKIVILYPCCKSPSSFSAPCPAPSIPLFPSSNVLLHFCSGRGRSPMDILKKNKTKQSISSCSNTTHLTMC